MADIRSPIPKNPADPVRADIWSRISKNPADPIMEDIRNQIRTNPADLVTADIRRQHLRKPSDSSNHVSVFLEIHSEAESKEKHGVCDPTPELTSPYIHSRVDYNTFTIGNPMPEVPLSSSQRFGRCC
jgi:hypothetical protein